MRLVFLAFYAFWELLESISCVFSMGPLGSNPTLTAKSFVINYFRTCCASSPACLDATSIGGKVTPTRAEIRRNYWNAWPRKRERLGKTQTPSGDCLPAEGKLCTPEGRRFI